MSKFNESTSNTNRTVNRAGGEAFVQSPKLELVSLVLTSFLKDGFYESASDRLERLQNLVRNMPDKKFAAKTAIYARNEFGMRSVSHVIAGEIAATVKGAQWTRPAFNKMVRRVDDMTEILSYYESVYGRKQTPNALKRGLADAVHKFDRYQLAKYRGEGKKVSLVDLFNVVHPKPADENETEMYRDLMRGTLKSVDTWEARLTEAGGDGDKKAEAWRTLLVEGRLPYFALLRNLRNIAEQAPEMVSRACERLVDKKQIEKSLVLPFRYMTALTAINGASIDTGLRREIDTAIRAAADISLSNVPELKGDTLVVLDDSASMTWDSGNGTSPAEIGCMFAAVLYKACNADMMLFSNTARYETPDHNAPVLTICDVLKNQFRCGGTNFHCIFQEANRAYDRVIILSDMQGWIGHYAPVQSFSDYKRRTGASPSIYSFDLNGHGDMMFPERGVYCLAGFSDKVLKLMSLLEADRDAMIHEIEAVQIQETP